jgi:hypothetical protein
MTDDRHPDETEPTDTPKPDTSKGAPPVPETKHIEDEGEPLGANLA